MLRAVHTPRAPSVMGHFVSRNWKLGTKSVICKDKIEKCDTTSFIFNFV